MYGNEIQEISNAGNGRACGLLVLWWAHFDFAFLVSVVNTGCRVSVKGYSGLGYLRYYGPCEGEDLMCGVEFDTALGDTDGTRGVSHQFPCNPVRGHVSF